MGLGSTMTLMMAHGFKGKGQNMGKSNVKIATDSTGAEWVQPAGLMKRFSLSRTTVYTLTQEMRKQAKYKRSFLDLSWTLKLVKLDDFCKFLFEKNGKYLKK